VEIGGNDEAKKSWSKGISLAKKRKGFFPTKIKDLNHCFNNSPFWAFLFVIINNNWDKEKRFSIICKKIGFELL